MRSFLRRLEILNFLERKREAVSTDELLQHLINSGHLNQELGDKPKSLQRIIQRDMQFLLGDRDEDGTPENDFGLTVTRGQSKTLLWHLEPYQHLNFGFERMPAFMALALSVTRKHLHQILPSNTQQELERVFQQADAKLGQQERKLNPTHYQRLTASVAFFQRGQSLRSPDFEMSILDTLYRAILTGKRVTLTYKTRTGNKDYDIHPYGVVFMLPKVYLLGIKDGDEQDIEGKGIDGNFRSFLVHRIESAMISRFTNLVPTNFDLSYYLQSGRMDVLIDSLDTQTYILKLMLSPHKGSNMISDLQSSPISHDQTLEEVDDSTWCLSASVRRTHQLRNWLLSLGADARILAPTEIKADILTIATAIQAQYI